MQKNLFIITVIVLALFTNTASAAIEDSYDLSPYNSYSFQKSENYTELDNWISSFYSTDENSNNYILAETITPTILSYGRDKGKDARVFISVEKDRYLINTVVDDGETLNLYVIDSEELGLSPNLMENRSTRKCDTCNCVTWVRCKYAPWLPYGLITLADKKAAINTQTAKKGVVAVMDIYYPYGHVGYLYKISGKKLYIKETNYKKCKEGERSGSKEELKIIGYIKEKKEK